MADTCTGCKYAVSKLTYLGFRVWCQRFKCLRSIRCVDWRKK